MTKAIEKALRYHHPSEVCGVRVNKFRSSHTAFEVPVVCGTIKAGLVDCMRVQEYFGRHPPGGILLPCPLCQEGQRVGKGDG